MTRAARWSHLLMGGLLLGTVQCRPVPEKPASVPDTTPPAQAVPKDTAGLGGTSWRLVHFQGADGRALTPDKRDKYTIAFGTDGKVSARIDCNRGRGTWTSSGAPHLEFGPLALTRAMCPPGSLHDRMVKHWPYVRSYILKDGHLFLSLMADGGIYEFEPASEQAAATASLENTYWKLMPLGDAPLLVSPDRPEPHLILNSINQRASGSGGCNRFSGTYQLNGDRLKLGAMTATLMACADGMETERSFLNALGRARRWKITGQRLDLLDNAGNVIARFEARTM
jgi:heat shock protein HslJ